MLETPKDHATNNVTAYGIIALMEQAMDNQQATQYEIGWLMGFLEGEGSVGLYWNRTREQIYPVIILVNTEPELINEASRILTKLGVGNYVKSHKMTGRKSHWKDRYDIYISGIKRCNKLLSAISSLWQIDSPKRRRARLVMEFCNSRLSNPCPENGRYTYREHELLSEFRATHRAVLRDYEHSTPIAA